jgi:hypothetical protein
VSFAESSRPHFQALPLETTGEGVEEPASANLSNGSKEIPKSRFNPSHVTLEEILGVALVLTSRLKRSFTSKSP